MLVCYGNRWANFHMVWSINHAREKYTLIYLVDDFSFLFHSSSRTRPTFSHRKMAKYSIATSIAMHFHKLHPEYPEKNSNSKIWWFSRCSHFSWNSIFIHKSHCHIVRFRFDISRAAFLAHTKFFCCFFFCCNFCDRSLLLRIEKKVEITRMAFTFAQFWTRTNHILLNTMQRWRTTTKLHPDNHTTVINWPL